MTAEEKVRELGLILDTPPGPLANYVPVVRTGNYLYFSGHIPPADANGNRIAGKLGAGMTTEQGYQVARDVTITLLTTLKRETNNLDSVRRIVKVVGFVNSAPDFIQQLQVVNGASDLLVEVFGPDIGRRPLRRRRR
jgi:enamine deaminase RidA (YjgF/YER057c/UK114 family)